MEEKTMKNVIDFLARLKDNNNREWFNEHKTEYQAAQAAFNEFAGRLISGLGEFDPSVRGISVKDCTYRIYRDTRFSSDKRPYKTHIGAFIAPHGKKSGYAGYYFQIGPEEYGYPSGNMLAAGHYCFDAKVLRLLREDISTDGGEFERTLTAAPLFTLDDENMLKRVPAGFEKEAPYSHYLLYRNYCLTYAPGRRFMRQDHLLERTLDAFRTTQPFLAYLNRAIAYAAEGNEERTSL